MCVGYDKLLVILASWSVNIDYSYSVTQVLPWGKNAFGLSFSKNELATDLSSGL